VRLDASGKTADPEQFLRRPVERLRQGGDVPRAHAALGAAEEVIDEAAVEAADACGLEWIAPQLLKPGPDGLSEPAFRLVVATVGGNFFHRRSFHLDIV